MSVQQWWSRAFPEEDSEQNQYHALLGHNLAKGRLTLLLWANASAHLRIKSLLVCNSQTPHAFNKMGTRPTCLSCRQSMRNLGSWGNGCMWCPNLLLRNIFLTTTSWKVPSSDTPSSLGGWYGCWVWLPEGHFCCPSTWHLFCSPWTSNWSKTYAKNPVSRCFKIIEEGSLNLKEIFHCPPLHQPCWQSQGRYHISVLNSAWRKLCPECVTENNFKGSDTQVMREIVSMGKTVSGQQQLRHKGELMEKELVELQREQQRSLHWGRGRWGEGSQCSHKIHCLKMEWKPGFLWE